MVRSEASLSVIERKRKIVSLKCYHRTAQSKNLNINWKQMEANIMFLFLQKIDVIFISLAKFAGCEECLFNVLSDKLLHQSR